MSMVLRESAGHTAVATRPSQGDSWRHDVWGRLPSRLRALYISTPGRTGGWLAEALAADRATDVHLEEAAGGSAGLARLRDELFDVVLISHDPGELDALELVEGLRASGDDEVLLVLGLSDEDEMAALAFEVGADAYLCVQTTTTRTLLWTAARAIERHQLIRENRRLRQAERQRLQQEHQETDRLLNQQRALVEDLEALSLADGEMGTQLSQASCGHETGRDVSELPAPLVCHYRELLRAYVVMGSGNLAAEMSGLAELLATAGVTAQRTMLLHVQVLEELVHDLGSRSARHVMTRADLLVLEVMIHLAECYRGRPASVGTGLCAVLERD